METLSISKFKATCLAAIERVHKTGQPLLITKNGKPAAVVSPPPPEEQKTEFGYGMYKDRIRILGDIVAPLGEDDWEVLK